MSEEPMAWERHELEGVRVFTGHLGRKTGASQSPSVLRCVSLSGGVFEGPPRTGEHIRAKFVRDGLLVLMKDCKVLRDWSSKGEHYAAFTFDAEATGDELKRLGVGEERKVALALGDQQEVYQEIREIQSCRNRVFLATTGTVTASFFAIIGLFWQLGADQKAAVSKKSPAAGVAANALPLAQTLPSKPSVTGVLNSHMTPPAAFSARVFCCSMGGILSVFAVGSLSMAEKCRAINLRRGFLCALAPYLRGAKKFEDYWGWSQLKHCLAECKGLRHAKHCGWAGPFTCRRIGEVLAAGLSSHKKLVPGVTDSFTSLCAWLFGFFYFFFMLFFDFALAQAIAESSWKSTFPFVFFLFLFSTSVSILMFRVPRRVGGFGLAIALLVPLFGCGMPGNARGMLLTIALGLIVGLLGWFLGKQLYAIRVGKHSLETHAYAWVQVLSRCDPVPFVERAREIKVRGSDESPTRQRPRKKWSEWDRLKKLGSWLWCRVIHERSLFKVREDYAEASRHTTRPLKRPIVMIDNSQSLRHVLTVFDSNSSLRPTRPEGVSGMEVWICRTPPSQLQSNEAAEFSLIALTRRTAVGITYSASDDGMNARYMLRWVNEKGEKGPWSETITALVAA